jgi:peptidoglycan/LPS O-acetylase OafA/YrhL
MRRSGDRTFYTIDALRGVAAAAVLMRHTEPIWGEAFWLKGSYLAVDLFFILSGFVLAHAYDARFAAGMSAGQFFQIRLIRLYPIYLLGCSVFVFGVISSWIAGIPGLWSVRTLTVATVLNTLYLPVPVPYWAPGDYPYILVPAAWSLFLELFVNALFAIFWPHLSRRVLATFCAISGCGLVLASFYYGSLAVGEAWSNMLGGYARVLFEFPLGVLLYRTRRSYDLPWFSPWLLLPVLMFLFWVPVGGVSRAVYDLIVVMLIFPAVILVGASKQPMGRSVSIFAFLGTTSYAVYVLHEPVFHLLHTTSIKLLHNDLQGFAPWFGFAYLAGLLALCWLVDQYFDVPVRRWLMRGLAPKRLKAA